jgi:predicted peroxiredoxin
MADTEKIVYIVTHAGEDPERATLPFVMANAALVMEVEAVVALQGTAVFLAKGDCMKHVFAAGLPRLHDLVQSFLDAGGRLLVCVPCIRERKIDEADLIPGATPAAAAALTQEVLTAKATLVY